MSLSKKDQDRLYMIIDREIMDARVKIAQQLQDAAEGKIIDNIMYALGNSAPKKAIDFLTAKPHLKTEVYKALKS